MMSGNKTRNAEEATYNRFMELAEGDEFGAVGSDWIVESVEREPRNCERVLTAARRGAEHEWARFTADIAALTVSAEIHDEDHEQCPDMNPHSVTSLTIHGGEEPEVRADGGVTTDGGEGASEDPLNTWRYSEGEDGEPTFARDEEMDVAVEFEREDGADSSEGTVTYIQPDGESITISPGDTILGPDGEEVVTVSGYCVTVGPYLSVDTYVDLPPEDGGGVPYSPHAFAIRWLGYEDNDGFHFHMGECTAASGEELERERWSDTLDTLRSLDEGDTVLWGERSEPLTVQWSVTFAPNVRLKGPRGGSYTITWGSGAPTVRRGGSSGESLGRPEGFRVS